MTLRRDHLFPTILGQRLAFWRLYSRDPNVLYASPEAACHLRALASEVGFRASMEKVLDLELRETNSLPDGLDLLVAHVETIFPPSYP